MATHRGNVAYDFELFEKKPPKAQPSLNLIKNQKYKSRDRMAAFKAVSAIAVVVSVICMMLYGRAELTELTKQVGDYNDSYQELSSEYTRLSAELEGKVSLRNVEETAKNELGLSKVQSYQVEYVNMDEGDGFEGAGDVQEPTLGQKFSLYIQSFLEYIKIR